MKMNTFSESVSFVQTSVLSSSASGSSSSRSGMKPAAFLCFSGLTSSSSMLIVVASLLASSRLPASSKSKFTAWISIHYIITFLTVFLSEPYIIAINASQCSTGIGLRDVCLQMMCVNRCHRDWEREQCSVTKHQRSIS